MWGTYFFFCCSFVVSSSNALSASMSRPGSARTPRSGLLVDPEAAEQQRPTTSAANASRSMVPAGTDALGSQALRAKNARIRAEQDRQLLQNRINRLIIEEEKAAKRISETRRRAKEIWDLKRRNEANQAARADAGSWMSSEQHLQRQLLTQARGERTTALDSSKAALAHMRKEEVSVLRQMRRENEEAVVAQRNMEHARCVARKQSVKQHQNDAAQRRNKVREAALEVQPQSRPRSQPHRNPNARTDPHAHPHPTPFSLASTLALAPALANANTPHSLPHPRPRPCPTTHPYCTPAHPRPRPRPEQERELALRKLQEQRQNARNVLDDDTGASMRHYQDLASEEQRLLNSLAACQEEQHRAYAQLESVVERPSTAA